MTIQAASSDAEQRSPIRRRVSPAIGRRGEVRARRGAASRPSATAASGSASAGGSSSGGVGRVRRSIDARVATAQLACQPAPVVTARAVTGARATVWLDSRRFRTSVRSSRTPDMRTYAPAEPGAVLERTCSPSRRSPAASSTTRSCRPRPAEYAHVPRLAGPADRRRAWRRAASSGRTPTRREAIEARPRRRGRRRRHADRVGQDAVLRPAGPPGASPTTRRRGRSSCSRPRRSARTRWPSSRSWPRRPG